jgi:hypothetical protein
MFHPSEDQRWLEEVSHLVTDHVSSIWGSKVTWGSVASCHWSCLIHLRIKGHLRKCLILSPWRNYTSSKVSLIILHHDLIIAMLSASQVIRSNACNGCTALLQHKVELADYYYSDYSDSTITQTSQVRIFPARWRGRWPRARPKKGQHPPILVDLYWLRCYIFMVQRYSPMPTRAVHLKTNSGSLSGTQLGLISNTGADNVLTEG